MKEQRTSQNSKATIEIDGSIFTRESILTACNYYLSDYYFDVTTKGNNVYMVTVCNKSPNTNLPLNIENEFRNNLVDQQLRNDLEKEFGVARTLLVEKAFSKAKASK
jgi:His-Xaa-Ser system protein HxsD